MDTVIELLTSKLTLDDYGVQRQTITAKQIFARVASVTRSEFFNANRAGLNPEMRFEIFHGDYDGQTLVRWQNKTYAVYRTYHVPGTDYLELYVQREGGANGKNQSHG